jgi:hypothetical protein
MCGIIAAFNKEGSVNEWVINQYEKQFSRGQRGFGSAFIAKDKTINVLRACEPTKALIDLYLNQATAIVMHHRLPTSTENYLDQTHPIKVSDGSLKYDYLVVHNGVVSNCGLLKKTHEELGFTYNTAYETTGGSQKFNDSESLAIEVARFIEDQTKEIGIQGSAAFVAIQVSKSGKDKGQVVRIFFGKNEGSPLNLSASNKKIRISSEGEGESVKPFTLYSFSPGSYSFDKEKMPFKALASTEIKSTIGFATNGEKKEYSALRSAEDWDDYYQGYKTISKIEADKEPTTGNLSKERAELVKNCREHVAMLVDNFLADIEDNNPLYQPEAGTVLGEIADALYDTQNQQEALMCTESETSPSGTTIFNQD